MKPSCRLARSKTTPRVVALNDWCAPGSLGGWRLTIRVLASGARGLGSSSVPSWPLSKVHTYEEAQAHAPKWRCWIGCCNNA
eukprot:352175-Chlamydomonas_euryale.AAC.5